VSGQQIGVEGELVFTPTSLSDRGWRRQPTAADCGRQPDTTQTKRLAEALGYAFQSSPDQWLQENDAQLG